MEKKKFMTAYLEDGTAVWIDKLEVGQDAWTVDENMDKVPLLDGSHKTKEGDQLQLLQAK